MKKAPWSFTICVLILSGVLTFAAYGLVDRFYLGEIKAKDATIQTLSLRPESTPKQLQELTALRKQVAELQRERDAKRLREWPALVGEEAKKWSDALAFSQIKNITVCFGPEVDAKNFLVSLREIGRPFNIGVNYAQGSTNPDEIDVWAFKGDPIIEKVKGFFQQMVRGANYQIYAKADGEQQAPEHELYIFLGERR